MQNEKGDEQHQHHPIVNPDIDDVPQIPYDNDNDVNVKDNGGKDDHVSSPLHQNLKNDQNLANGPKKQIPEQAALHRRITRTIAAPPYVLFRDSLTVRCDVYVSSPLFANIESRQKGRNQKLQWDFGGKQQIIQFHSCNTMSSNRLWPPLMTKGWIEIDVNEISSMPCPGIHCLFDVISMCTLLHLRI